jgi:hypothetical protein
MHSARRYLWLVLAALALLPATPALAASNYSENFDDGLAQNWSTVSSWAVTSQYYGNTVDSANPAIAFYNNDTWTSNFTYNARMYSQYGSPTAPGNKVGAVFNYTDSSNYYRVLINTLGDVVLEKVTAGTVTQVSGGSGTVTGVASDMWFDVQLVLSGSSITARVNGQVAFSNVALTGLIAGRVGVLSVFNLGRFDNFSIQLSTTYTENFNDNQAQGWTTSGSTFVAAGGYYAPSVDSANPSIAVYGGATVTTNYTYRLRMRSNYGASGNKLGAVFSYVDSNNFYELSLNMAGTVTLNKITNGTSALVANGSTATVAEDQWFDVEIVLNGNSITARIAGATVLNNVSLTTVPAGRVGVLTRFNMGLFDDIELVYPASGANLLFKTGYDGAVIGPPIDCGLTGNCWQRILDGTDTVTGFSWPLRLWYQPGDSTTTNDSKYQLIVVDDGVDESEADDYILNQIQTVTGPHGNQTKTQYQGILKAKENVNTVKSIRIQDPYIITSSKPKEAQGPIYIRQWMKISPTSGPGVGSWRNIIQWKTVGDYRVSLDISTFAENYSSPDHFWRLRGDNDANANPPLTPTPVHYWECLDETTPVPVSTQWFKLEMFWDRKAPGQAGRVWIAINGQTMFNVTDQVLWGVNNAPINRIMAQQLYTGADANASTNLRIEQWTDDFEIWDNFPADATAHPDTSLCPQSP